MNQEIKKQPAASRVEHETMQYKDGELEYLDINREIADPTKNKIVVIPGFTQGIEVLEGFGEALGDDGNREVYVLDQPNRFKKKFDKKFKGEIGLDQQVNALLEFLIEEDLTEEPIDFVANSFGTSVLAAAAIRANQLGFKSFKTQEGANTFFISAAGANPEESMKSLGKRWLGWIKKNAANDKVLDPTREMFKAGQKNFLGDVPKTLNEAIALSKYKINFEELEKAGVKPVVIGYADDALMPFQEVAQNIEHIEGAVSLIDHEENAPILPNSRPYPGAKDRKEFEELAYLETKSAKQEWPHHYRAAEHNDMQFHPDRAARFIIDVLSRKEQQK
jgi:pimeloyl-ACP methyl ester carboxylesterase